MTKLRVHELAKELGMENKDLMEILEKKNVEAKTSMSSIPNEVVAELRSGHAGKGTSEDAPKKKISYRYSAHRIRRAETAAREDPVREMDRTHREHPVQDRPAGEERTASGFRSEWIPSGSSGERAAGKMERERTEDHRKDARQETDVRKRDREAVSVRIVRQMEETGSVRLLLQTVREETVARTRGKNGQRPDSRRNDRNDRNDRNSIPSPLVEQQKPQATIKQKIKKKITRKRNKKK